MDYSPHVQAKALAAIYDAALEPNHWPAALDAVASSLGGTGASIVSCCDDEIEMRLSTSPVDALARDSYNRHYGDLDDVIARLTQAKVGTPIGCYELVERGTLLGSEFYADWLRRIDLGDGIFFVLQRTEAATISLQIGAPLGDEDFATPDRKRLTEFLSTHIRRALIIQNRLATTDAPLVAYVRADHFQHPVAILGGQGRIIHSTRSFCSAIARCQFSIFRGLIQATTLAEQAEIDRALFHATRVGGERTGASLAFGSGGRARVALHVLPIGESLLAVMWPDARALVLAEPAGQSPVGIAWLREVYGLTEAEAAVTMLLVTQPTGLRSIAQGLGVSLSTVKTHLQHIFDKTGVRRQAELVRLVVSATGQAPVSVRASRRGAGPPRAAGAARPSSL